MKKKDKILLGAVFLIVILLSLCSSKKILEGMTDKDDNDDKDNDEHEDTSDKTLDDDDEHGLKTKKNPCNKSVEGQEYVGNFHNKHDHFCVYKTT